MKRKNLITLLAFFPLFSVWGQSSLNPVEKEKLKLPELPQTMLRATAQANEQVDYTKGTFIVRGLVRPQNSTVNFCQMTESGHFGLSRKKTPVTSWDVPANSVRFTEISSISFPNRRKIRVRPLSEAVWRLSMRKR